MTHCRPNDEPLILQEFLVYRSYNLLTDLSLQARLARIEYRDTQKPDLVEAFWGFFLEDEDDMAKRNNGKLFKEQGGGFVRGQNGDHLNRRFGVMAWHPRRGAVEDEGRVCLRDV